MVSISVSPRKISRYWRARHSNVLEVIVQQAALKGGFSMDRLLLLDGITHIVRNLNAMEAC